VGVGDVLLVEGRWRRVTTPPSRGRLEDIEPNAEPYFAGQFVHWVRCEGLDDPVVRRRDSTVPRIPAPVLEALRCGVRDPYRG
ncbi:MAG: hypothetical protein KAJ19_12040, partial [Gammaproteobacteria bacterium]|nr:hypothetical protein [Gammaproteobacteria bacterium]